jgi:hypothetical protein
MSQPIKWLIAGIILIAAPNLASASVYSFSLVGDPSISSPGTVTGLIFGLDEAVDGNQVPTGLEVLTSPSALGLTNFFIPHAFHGTFDLSGGEIIGVGPPAGGIDFQSRPSCLRPNLIFRQLEGTESKQPQES